MKKNFNTFKYRKGFSLAEVLTSLTIGAMILAAVLGIYSRAEHSASAITHRLSNYRLPNEILQRIAEDLDSVISSGSDTNITIENGFEHGFSTARLTIKKTINDEKNIEQTFEEIIWQSSYDYESLTDGLVLYRCHSGLTQEDKMLNNSKEDWERELFVPICSGVTLFKVNAIQGEQLLEKWNEALPTGIKVTLSFAEPVEKADGSQDVPDEEKNIRTIAIDRTRKITFAMTGAVSQEQKNEATPEESTDFEKTLTNNDEQTTLDNKSKKSSRKNINMRQKSNDK
jgi:prepilin-type N-terminal cleavage/methylation domain-containing protein